MCYLTHQLQLLDVFANRGLESRIVRADAVDDPGVAAELDGVARYVSDVARKEATAEVPELSGQTPAVNGDECFARLWC